MSQVNPKRVEEYKKWHWGEPAAQVLEWPDNDLPDELIECGRLLELHVKGLPAIKIRWARRNLSHVTYDPNHKFKRLYLLLPHDERAGTKRTLFTKGRQTHLLADIAKKAGGRHATNDYPHLLAMPIGLLDAVVYLTVKKGDGLSKYIHHFGEVSGIKPILAVDTTGRFWICGGNYTTPVPGITD